MRPEIRSGAAWLLLSAGILMFWCVSTEVPGSMLDFEAVYFGSRCLIEHHDPYQASQFQQVFDADRGEIPAAATGRLFLQAGVVNCVNLPTSLILIVPLALLPWGLAHTLWMILTVLGLMTAAFMTWRMTANDLHGFTLFLCCFWLLNCKVVASDGNASGLAVALCVIGACCILNDRRALLGVACLAMSMVLKPHTTGAMWLFFMLGAGNLRRRALQTLFLAGVLCVPALVVVNQVSPHWMTELAANAAKSAAPFGINQPGPDSFDGLSPLAIVDMQTVFSVFRNEPRFYESASYLLCGPLLLGWAIKTLRSRPAKPEAYLGVAVIASLSVLPLYHRMYDAKLMLLTVPACVLLASEGGVKGRIALLLTTGSFVLTGDIPLIILKSMTKDLHISMAGAGGKIALVLLNRPAPLVLLTMGSFYLWAYLGRRGQPCKRAAAKEIPAIVGCGAA